MTSGIIEILKEDATLVAMVGTAIVGTDAQAKIYPMSIPQNVVYPFITVAEVSLNPMIAKGCAYDYGKPHYEILSYSRSFRQAELLQQQVRRVLDTGNGFDTDAGALFDQIYMIDRNDLYLPAQGEESGLYVKRGMYECMVRET